MIQTESPHQPLEDVLAELQSRAELDIWMVLECRGDTAMVAAASTECVALAVGDCVPWDDTVCARMVAREGPHVAGDLAEVPAYATAALAERLRLGAYIGAPIRVQGRVAGTLCGVNTTTRKTRELSAVLSLVELCAGLIGQIWEAQAEACTDRLTGLANRRGWENAMAREQSRSIRNAEPVAVLAVDLDDFKAVNDTYGHAAGDRYLRRAAATLDEVVRDHEQVARWGGDEFVVLAVGAAGDETDALCARLRRRLLEAGTPASCGASVVDGDLTTATAAALDAVREEKREKEAGRALL